MIHFKHVRWKNFMSYGHYFTEFPIDDKKLSIVTAVNGSGKSVVIDAIVFSLFGRPYRKINKPGLINSINAKGMVVEVTFDITETNDSYKIIRGMKPNVFEIYKNGKKFDEKDSSRDQQKYLEENILKSNYRAFTQLVVLGSSNYVPFMHLTPAQRRDFIENILDINIFSLMNQMLKEKNGILKELKRDNDQKITNVKSNMEIQENLVNRIKQQSRETEENIQSKIEHIEQESTGHKEKRKELEQQLEEVNEHISEYAEDNLLKNKKKGSEYLSEIKVSINHIRKDRNFMENHTSCPTCKQSISEFHRTEFIENKDKELGDKERLLEEVSDKFGELETSLKNLDSLKTQRTKISGEISLIDRQLEQLENTERDLRKQQTKHEDSTEDINEEERSLEKMERKLEDYRSRDKFLQARKGLFNVAFDLLRDSGIKSQIISQYIPIINKLVSGYLQEMDFPVAFTLDKDFNESILSRYRDSFTYDSFSQGEKNRIDLALLFTWRAIAEIKNSINTNILIFDEIFDGSLDYQGIEVFLKILEGVSKKSNIFIISHKIESGNDIFDRVIRVEKHQDFSYLQDTTSA